MSTLPVGFQQGSIVQIAKYDRNGNLDSAVTRVLGAAAAGTEAANAVSFPTGPAKMLVTTAGAVGAGGAGIITVSNPIVTTNSVIVVTPQSTTVTADGSRKDVTVSLKSVSAGQFVLHFYNPDAATTTGSVVLHVAVL